MHYLACMILHLIVFIETKFRDCNRLKTDIGAHFLLIVYYYDVYINIAKH